ncbi:Bestrophin, RFP-TM, chloride channel [compost metagenome]
MLVQTPFDWYVVFYRTAPRAALAAAAATAVVVLDVLFDRYHLSIPTAYIALLGTAISVILGFKNTQAYDRWWEARRLWGEILNESRTLARLAMAAEPAAWQQSLIRRQIAFAHAARLHLRRQGDFSSLRAYLSPEEFAAVQRSPNIPATLVVHHSRELAQVRSAGAISDFEWMLFEQSLARLTTAYGGCERIKNTPFPRQYDDFAQMLVWTFGLMFPFSLVQTLGYWTIPGSIVIAAAFQILDGIGRNVQAPFENNINDTPMSAIGRTIERDLLHALGEESLPPPLAPQRGVLM